jgi:hypothetical protein
VKYVIAVETVGEFMITGLGHRAKSHGVNENAPRRPVIALFVQSWPTPQRIDTLSLSTTFTLLASDMFKKKAITSGGFRYHIRTIRKNCVEAASRRSEIGPLSNDLPYEIRWRPRTY